MSPIVWLSQNWYYAFILYKSVWSVSSSTNLIASIKRIMFLLLVVYVLKICGCFIFTCHTWMTSYQGKAKLFIASISQRYTSNWSKATLKGQQPIKRVTKEKETFKTERNRAVGTTEPLQHTERLRHGSSGGEGSLFNVYIHLLVPHSGGIRAQDL